METKSEISVFGNIIAAILVIGFMILIMLPSALAIMLCWNWFILPFGLKSLNIWHAMGLDLLISNFLIPPVYPEFQDGKARLKFYWNRLKNTWLLSAMSIVLGWIIVTFLL